MYEASTLGAAALLSLLGFGMLALGQERHWQTVTGLGEHKRIRSAPLLAAGLMLQAAACGLFVKAEGASFGALLWVLSMTATAMTVALTLTWRPSALRWLAAGLVRRWA